MKTYYLIESTNGKGFLKAIWKGIPVWCTIPEESLRFDFATSVILFALQTGLEFKDFKTTPLF